MNVCIKTKSHSYTCWRRCRISRSCVSTLKADFNALQWIQLSLHHAEGLALLKKKKNESNNQVYKAPQLL